MFRSGFCLMTWGPGILIGIFRPLGFTPEHWNSTLLTPYERQAAYAKARSASIQSLAGLQLRVWAPKVPRLISFVKCVTVVLLSNTVLYVLSPQLPIPCAGLFTPGTPAFLCSPALGVGLWKLKPQLYCFLLAEHPLNKCLEACFWDVIASNCQYPRPPGY